MDGLQITALKQGYGQNPLNYENVTSLRYQVDAVNTPLKLNLGPAGTSEASSGILTFADTAVPGNLIEDLIQNPQGVVFSVANYTITTTTDGITRSFSEKLQNVNDRTALIKIDYGTSRKGEIEDYHVATFNPESNSGDVTLAYVLEEILNLKHYDEATAPALSQAEMESSYSTKMIDGVETLWRIRDVARDDSQDKTWLLLLQEGSGAQTSTSYDPKRPARELVLSPEKTVTLALRVDADNDGVPDRLELKLGSSDKLSDSDEDGLSDNFEAYTDWTIQVNGASGKVGRKVRSSPALFDTDTDGISDYQEYLSREDLLANISTLPTHTGSPSPIPPGLTRTLTL